MLGGSLDNRDNKMKKKQVGSTVKAQSTIIIFYSAVLACIILALTAVVVDGDDTLLQPFHVRLSKSTDTIYVSWNTKRTSSSSHLMYTPSLIYGTTPEVLNMTIIGGLTKSYQNSTGFTHTVAFPMKKLKLARNYSYYYYRVGMVQGSAKVLSSKIYQLRASLDTRIIIYGDMGISHSPKTIDSVYRRLVNEEKISLVCHVGDISYADDFPGPLFDRMFDRWLGMIEGIASFVPYQVIPGNHDAGCKISPCHKWKQDFSPYNSLFTMPSYYEWKHNMFYSFDHGNIHFSSISTETDYPNAPFHQKFGDQRDQMTWLKEDLKRAVANRRNVPWIIVLGHRPIYSSHIGFSKNGKPLHSALILQQTIERLLVEHKVDVYMAGHVHSYERHHPVFNNTVDCDESSNNCTNQYLNPKYPIHVVNGAAGCEEGLSHGSAFRHLLPSSAKVFYTNYGYGVMDTREVEVGRKRRLSLTWQFFASTNDQLVDEMVIIKDLV